MLNDTSFYYVSLGHTDCSSGERFESLFCKQNIVTLCRPPAGNYLRPNYSFSFILFDKKF